MRTNVAIRESESGGRWPAREGSIALLREILFDAIRIYCRGLAADRSWSPEFREAKRWLLDDSASSLTSCVTLCELFSIDPEKLRRALLRFPVDPDPQLIRLVGAIRD